MVAGPRGIVLHPAPGAAVVPADGGLGDVIERRDDVLVCPEAIEDPMQRMARAADLLERLAAAREAPVGASLPDPAPTGRRMSRDRKAVRAQSPGIKGNAIETAAASAGVAATQARGAA